MNQSSKAEIDQNINLPISPETKKLQKLKGAIVVIKFGGNAMINESVKKSAANQLSILKKLGIRPVIVHGGGPVIKKLLEDVGLESTFIGGHRRTGKEAIGYVEMALSGQVNGEIVKELNSLGMKAVGLSGKDASMVKAVKRRHSIEVDGEKRDIDLGHVGDVSGIQTELLLTLLDNDYTPVLAPIGVGTDDKDYNINADMFAGHVAGALKATAFIAMTNVDGLLANPDSPDSLISNLSVEEAKAQIGKSIQGGMIPKVEACLIALEQGVESAHIINGMQEETLLTKLLTSRKCGTTIEAIRL